MSTVKYKMPRRRPFWRCGRCGMFIWDTRAVAREHERNCNGEMPAFNCGDAA